jgi:hypothetical protein
MGFSGKFPLRMLFKIVLTETDSVSYLPVIILDRLPYKIPALSS